MRAAPSRQTASLAGLALCFTLAACASPIAAGLDDAEASRVVVALEARALEARKEPDPAGEGRFRVTVADADTSRALVALAEEGLPRPHSVGLLEAVGKSALVPSLAAERASLAAGLGGELERSLMQIEGIASARVHLNLPSESPLRERKEKGSASVLLTYRGAASPLSEAQVKRVVAAGAPELAPDDVIVVAIARPASRAEQAALAHVGPLAVATGSAAALKAVLGGLMLLVGALAAATLVLYLKVARLRGERGAA